jgi:hypothetical protein
VSDELERQAEQPISTRGEAAWKEVKDRIAERNEKTRKAGKLRRQAHERRRQEARQAAELRRMAELLDHRRTS